MKLRLEKTRAFWLYIVIGAISAILGAMLLPVWREFDKLFFHNWGEHAVYIMISCLLFAYIFFYLVKRIDRYYGTPAQIVAIVELVIMVIIAVICAVSAFFKDFSLGDTCQIFGLSLWTRGVSGVFTGYYCDCGLKKKEKCKAEEKTEGGRVDDFTVWRLSFAVLLITAGAYFFVAQPFDDNHLQWVFSCAIILVGLFFIFYGIILKPAKRREKITVNETGGSKAVPNDEEEERIDNEEKKESKIPKNKDTQDDGKVRIVLDQSANAMTCTDAYDALWDEDLPVPVEKGKKKKK